MFGWFRRKPEPAKRKPRLRLRQCMLCGTVVGWKSEGACSWTIRLDAHKCSDGEERYAP